jgi:hypothetical protein
MKYKLTMWQRHKPTFYLITNDETIVWVDQALTGWEGRSIQAFIAWVNTKDVGAWSVVGADCQPPRVVYSEQTNEELAA